MLHFQPKLDLSFPCSAIFQFRLELKMENGQNILDNVMNLNESLKANSKGFGVENVTTLQIKNSSPKTIPNETSEEFDLHLFSTSSSVDNSTDFITTINPTPDDIDDYFCKHILHVEIGNSR